jgi:EAL domain-containing protein (putative c-di-GMP-specific phosphodiesterase class I)
VAHDFNNVIAAIMGYAHMLEEDLEPSDTRREDVSEILRAAGRATALTRQLLSLSHQRVTEPHSVDLHEVVRGLERMLRRVIGEDIDLGVLLHARQSNVLGDPGQLEQILMNLAVNARDAMPRGGKLTIETSDLLADETLASDMAVNAGRYVAFSVTDTGVGMDPNTQARIFEPFFTTKERGRGTGLGLSTVYGIVQQSQGHILCYSQLGKGTSFRVYLPRSEEAADVEQDDPADEVERVALRPRTDTTVLVVEDDGEVLRIASRILRNHGYRVLEASGAEQAHNSCLQEAGEIHLLLADLLLRDARGTELARQLVKLCPGMRVLYMSGYPTGALAHHGALATDARLIEKPFAPRALLAAVAETLADAEKNGQGSGALSTPGEAAPRALVVDDDPSVRRVLVRLSQLAGLEVREAEDGAQAAQLVRTESFDVIVSDVAMPGMTGIELLREVRRHDLDVPVVLITGAPDVSSASEAVQYGAFRYLGKPIDAQRLHDVLSQALRFHRFARIKREALAAIGRGASSVDLAGLDVCFERALQHAWVAFQPVVDAHRRAVFGFEALLRSDEASMATPLELLAAAEQLGRMDELGMRVRELVAEAASEAPPDSSLFVNVRTSDVVSGSLASSSSPLAPLADRVVFELTERLAVTDPPMVKRHIEQLRKLGYRIALDGLGATDSGIATFAQLEPDIAKIDRTMVRHLHLHERRRHLVGELVSLCHDMGAKVVGEGVETPEERDCAMALGCDLLQGYFFARPAPQFHVPSW